MKLNVLIVAVALLAPTSFAFVINVEKGKDRIIDVSELADTMLDDVNKKLTQMGWGIIPLPSRFYEETELSHGVLLGANSLYRQGPATFKVSSDNSTVTVSINVAHRLFQIAYGKAIFNETDDSMTVIWDIGTNTFNIVSTTVRNNETCKVTLNSFKWVAIDNVTQRSSLADYNAQDVSAPFKRFVLSKMNEEVEKKIPIIEKYMTAEVCHQKPPHPHPHPHSTHGTTEPPSTGPLRLDHYDLNKLAETLHLFNPMVSQ